MKIAQFKNSQFEWTSYYEHDEFENSAAFQRDYVRVSDYVEVDFVPLPRDQQVQARLRALDAQEVEVRANAAQKLKDLADARAKLLSLTHETAT